MKKIKSFFILSLLLPTTLLASPIFFKCDEKGQLSEFLTGKEVLQGLEKMQALLGGNKNKLFEALCEGGTECEKTLSQVLALNKISSESAQKQRDELLVKLKSQMNLSPIKKVNDETYNLEKSIREASANVAACRQTLVSLNPDEWVKEGCVSFFYPVKNEYTYASGYKIRNGKAEKQMCSNPESLKQSIRKALIMGVDPVVYMSIGLMEGGFGGWNSLYLDPIGVMKAMGCPEKKSDVTKADPNKLNSFGNFHSIGAAKIKDDKLNARLATYLKDVNVDVQPGKQFYCTQVTSSQSVLLDSADPKQCCVEFNFKVSDPQKVSEGLVQHYMYKMRSQRPYGSSDPAFRLQSFNGFTKLMGGAEGVQVFRSGVDYTKNPAYGYQAMDFILNNLQANPWLIREIEAQKKDLKLKELPPSILCEGSGKGAFHIDSKHYLNLHKNSGRMTSILNKPYNKMTDRQKKVISQEISHMISKDMFPKEINGKKVTDTANSGIPHYGEFKPPKYEIESSNGKKTNLKMDYTTGPDEFKNAIPFDELKSGFSYKSKLLQYDVKPLKGKPLVMNTHGIMFSYPTMMIQPIYPGKIEYADGSTLTISYDLQPSCSDKKKKTIDCNTVFQKMYQDIKVTDASGAGYEIKYKKVDESLKKGFAGGYGSMASVSETEEEITYNAGKSWTKWKIGFDKTPAKAPVEDDKKESASMDELVSYYFKNLHKDRSTIEKASTYGPWKELSDEDIKAIGEAATVPQFKGYSSGGVVSGSGAGIYGGGMPSGAGSGYGIQGGGYPAGIGSGKPVEKEKKKD